MKKTILSSILKASVSLLFIVILLYAMREKYDQILATLKGTNVALFGLGALVFLSSSLAASLRLKLIVQAEDAARIKFSEVVSLTLVGYFFNNFLPTSIGGDIVKAYYLSKKTRDKMASYTSVFVDRALGLFTMIFMAVAALLFVGSRVIDPTTQRAIYIIAAVSIAGIIFMMNKNFAMRFAFLLRLFGPLGMKLKEAYNAIHKFRKHKALMIKSLAISVVSQLVYFSSIGVIAVSIGLRIPVLDILLRMPIVSAMSLLPSINGLGLREGSTVLLYGPLVGKENAFALSILLLALLFLISILGGLIYVISPQFKVRLKVLEKEEEKLENDR